MSSLGEFEFELVLVVGHEIFDGNRRDDLVNFRFSGSLVVVSG